MDVLFKYVCWFDYCRGVQKYCRRTPPDYMTESEWFFYHLTVLKHHETAAYAENFGHLTETCSKNGTRLISHQHVLYFVKDISS